MNETLRNKIIGKKLRELRLKKDITEHEVASVLNKDTSIYSRMERGERAIKENEAAFVS